MLGNEDSINLGHKVDSVHYFDFYGDYLKMI